MELLGFSLELDNNHGLFTGATFDLEWPKFDVSLNSLVRELATNKTFSVEDSVNWVSSSLILCSVTDETLVFSEGYVGGSGVESLVVSDNFNFVVLPDTDA